MRAVRASQRQGVQRALHNLSEDERYLVAMFYEQGLDASQVAACLGISPAGVRMRKKRLLARLQDKLKGATEMSLEDNLHTQARPALESEAEPHLEDERLAEAAEGTRPLERAERAHLSRCTECRDVLAAAAVAAPAAPAQVITPRRWLRVAVPFIAAAAGALFMVSKASPPPASSEYQVRGKPGRPAEAASVSFLATDPDGRRRDLFAGDTVRRGERLGFRYGNPTGAAQTLTIIGWDGETVHWYYPSEEGGAPTKLQQGPKARSLRFPWDDKIGPEYKAGRLSLIVAFDADPKALASRVRRGDAVAATELRLRVLP